MNVLIVEDDQLLLRSLQNAVLSLRPNAAVRGARSIEDADRELGAGAPDFILLDLGLPDSDGYSGLGHLRAAAPTAAIAVVSGVTERDVMHGAFARGASAYLEKSHDPRQFMRALRTFFDQGSFAPSSIVDSRPTRNSRSSE